MSKRRVESAVRERLDYLKPPLCNYPHYYLVKASQAYSDMHQRCYNESHKLYPRYGGRGIRVEIERLDFYVWYCGSMVEFEKKFPDTKQSVNRIDHDKSYAIDNIEMIPFLENAADSFFRSGNISPWGTKLDEIQALVVHTFPSCMAGELAKHYNVNKATIRSLKKGINRKFLYKSLYE